MSLNGSMWTGVSGLLAHTEKMNVIGNNIANVNTVGFKSQRMDFSDFIYANSYNTSGLMQMGLGTTPQTIITSFTQGAFESTTNPTDLAINGSGFFRVNKEGTDEAYYTRAGNFNFDNNGYLKDPNGLCLQGWYIDNSGGVNQSSGGLAAGGSTSSEIKGTGVPTDIKLDAWTVQPFATTYMSFIPNLSADAGADNAVNTSNPFTALFAQWDGTQPPATDDTPPISDQAYEYQMSMKVYDESGTSHTITVYFDKVDSNTYTGGTNGGSIWEYIVTMEPSEDQRQYWEEDPRIQPEGGQLIDVSSTAMAGMLGAGTIEFNSAGQAINQSTYTFLGSGTPETDPDNYVQIDDGSGTLVWVPSLHSGAIVNPDYAADPFNEPQYIVNDYVTQNITDLEMWRSAEVSADGYPILVANFTGILGSQTTGSPDAASALIEINFGLKASNTDHPWTATNGSLADMVVEPYLYNPNYNALNPSYGPQYFLLNENYSTTSMGQINSILSTLRTEWNNYELTYDYIDPDTLTTTSMPMTFDVFLEYYQNANNLDEAFTYITGTSGTNATAVDEAKATAILAFSMLSDPDGSSIPGMSLIETAFQYKFNDYTTGYEGMVDSAGNAIDRDLYDGTAIPDINSNAMQYIMSYQIDGSAKVDLSNLAEATPSNANALSTFNSAIRESSAIQSNAGSSATYSQSQNGYAFGNLSAYYVDQDGILSGVYSNGITLGLYQICMYDFVCDQGLRAEGGNLWSQTIDSGEPKSGPAGVAGLGTIISECIEQSNVDLAREFVLMITTQRGFQGNSKMITTVDTMLDTVIQMKR